MPVETIQGADFTHIMMNSLKQREVSVGKVRDSGFCAQLYLCDHYRTCHDARLCTSTLVWALWEVLRCFLCSTTLVWPQWDLQWFFLGVLDLEITLLSIQTYIWTDTYLHTITLFTIIKKWRILKVHVEMNIWLSCIGRGECYSTLKRKIWLWQKVDNGLNMKLH